MKIITSDEGQGESERVEVLARRIKSHLSGVRISELRAGMDKAINERAAKQAAADKKRYVAIKKKLKDDANTTSQSTFWSAVIDGTVKLPRLPDGYKPRRCK